MRSPEGETTGDPSGPRRSVRVVISPVETSTRCTSESTGSRTWSSWRLALKTRAPPSGVHDSGPPWSYGPEVSRRGVPPSAGRTKRWSWPGSSHPAPSARYCSAVVTRKGGPQSAPSGFAGIRASSGASPGTNMLKAIRSPSGDQASPEGPCSRVAIRAVCPSSIQRTQSSEPPSSSPRT